MTLTQLLLSHRDATRKLATDSSYANSVPTSLHVVAELRKQGVDPRVHEVKTACVLVGLKLADV